MNRINEDQFDPDLDTMLDAYRDSDSTFVSSEYWAKLSNKHIEQLRKDGFENFKQTVAMNYFTFFAGLREPYVKFLLQKLPVSKIVWSSIRAFVSRKHQIFSKKQSLIYNFVNYLLWEYIIFQGDKEILTRLYEPLEGNPLSCRFKGKEISQDLGHSILEFLSISKGITDLNSLETIVELGAGYGRTAYVFMSLLPKVRYIVVDIPPALYVSQRYLSKLFPEKKIFKFRLFRDFSEVAEEFKSCQVAFFLPSQLESLPLKTVDLFMAIDSLHEMRLEQIKKYFFLIEALTRKYFYFKCWKITKIPYDNIILSEKDYPVKQEWNRIFWHDCDILNLTTCFGSDKVNATYFEALLGFEKIGINGRV
jgi:putative sugar O-methyltransferase